LHDYATFNWVMTGTDVFACEGTSAGVHVDGSWRAGVSHAGRWCDVFEVREDRCLDVEGGGSVSGGADRVMESGGVGAGPVVDVGDAGGRLEVAGWVFAVFEPGAELAGRGVAACVGVEGDHDVGVTRHRSTRRPHGSWFWLATAVLDASSTAAAL
jgi:hypothetical protein